MVKNSHSAVCLLAGVALALGTGCVRSPQPPSPAGASGLQCAGGYAVTVANNTAIDVDIWQFTSGQWAYVASVSAHTTSELPLSGGGPVQWRWPPKPPRYDPNLSVDFTLHMHCS